MSSFKYYFVLGSTEARQAAPHRVGSSCLVLATYMCLLNHPPASTLLGIEELLVPPGATAGDDASCQRLLPASVKPCQAIFVADMPVDKGRRPGTSRAGWCVLFLLVKSAFRGRTMNRYRQAPGQPRRLGARCRASY